MRRNFGGQTVTIVSVSENPAVRDRYNEPEEVRTETDIPGCHFRPLSAKEKIELGEIVTDPWKLTAPPVAAVVNAQADDEVKVEGITYQIVGGPRVFHDFSRPFKVTVICQRIGS